MDRAATVRSHHGRTARPRTSEVVSAAAVRRSRRCHSRQARLRRDRDASPPVQAGGSSAAGPRAAPSSDHDQRRPESLRLSDHAAPRGGPRHHLGAVSLGSVLATAAWTRMAARVQGPGHPGSRGGRAATRRDDGPGQRAALTPGLVVHRPAALAGPGAARPAAAAPRAGRRACRRHALPARTGRRISGRPHASHPPVLHRLQNGSGIQGSRTRARRAAHGSRRPADQRVCGTFGAVCGTDAFRSTCSPSRSASPATACTFCRSTEISI